MCLSSALQSKDQKKSKKRGACASFLLADYYEQEIKFNVRGKTSVPSYTGIAMSLLIRCLILVFAVERIMAWLSFDRFKVLRFETQLDLDQEGATSIETNYNFSALGFDFMIGFDGNLPEEIGYFDVNLLTFSEDGQVTELEPLSTQECAPEHPGVAYAEREVELVYGQDFSLRCISQPQLVGITGNKHSDYSTRRVSVSFSRCSEERLTAPDAECKTLPE